MFYRSYARIEKQFNESNISSVVDFIYSIDPSNRRQMKKLNKWFIENWFQVDIGVGVAHEDKEKPHESGRKYFNGYHADGEKFKDHQKRLI